MQLKDYYQILELTPEASPEDIKRAYRKLVREYHPDAVETPRLDKSFVDIQEAYEVLGDPALRDDYDRSSGFHDWREEKLQRYREQQEAADREVHNEEFRPGQLGSRLGGLNGFSFGRAAAQEHVFDDSPEEEPPPRAEPRQNPRSAEKQESIFQKLKSSIKPPPRQRTQSEQPTPEARPTEGLGSLRGERVYRFSIDGLESLMGTSREVALEHGNEVRMVRVKIPAGVCSGDTLNVQCPAKDHFPPQRIRVAITIHPHHLVEREGSDIVLKIPVTISEAIKGAEVEVPTPHGPLKVKIPSWWGTQGRLRVKGRGVALSTGEVGDLYIKTTIVAPRTPSAEAEALAEAFERLYEENVRDGLPSRFGSSTDDE